MSNLNNSDPYFSSNHSNSNNHQENLKLIKKNLLQRSPGDTPTVSPTLTPTMSSPSMLPQPIYYVPGYPPHHGIPPPSPYSHHPPPPSSYYYHHHHPGYVNVLPPSPIYSGASHVMTVTQQNQPSQCPSPNNGEEKIKPSNFPVQKIKIGTYEKSSQFTSDIVAKFYYTKKQIVWEISPTKSSSGLKYKMVFGFIDITFMKYDTLKDETSQLVFILKKMPKFYKETNPQPKKNTMWTPCDDFLPFNEASIYCRHSIICKKETLDKNIDKLKRSEPRISQMLSAPFDDSLTVFPSTTEEDIQSSTSPSADSTPPTTSPNIFALTPRNRGASDDYVENENSNNHANASAESESSTSPAMISQQQQLHQPQPQTPRRDPTSVYPPASSSSHAWQQHPHQYTESTNTTPSWHQPPPPPPQASEATHSSPSVVSTFGVPQSLRDHSYSLPLHQIQQAHLPSPLSSPHLASNSNLNETSSTNINTPRGQHTTPSSPYQTSEHLYLHHHHQYPHQQQWSTNNPHYATPTSFTHPHPSPNYIPQAASFYSDPLYNGYHPAATNTATSTSTSTTATTSSPSLHSSEGLIQSPTPDTMSPTQIAIHPPYNSPPIPPHPMGDLYLPPHLSPTLSGSTLPSPGRSMPAGSQSPYHQINPSKSPKYSPYPSTSQYQYFNNHHHHLTQPQPPPPPPPPQHQQLHHQPQPQQYQP